MLKLQSHQRVIVQLPNAFGDSIMATPFLDRLSKRIPPQNLTLLGKASNLELLSANPWSNQSIIYSPTQKHRGFRGMLKLAGEIRQKHFDAAFLLPNSMRSALCFWLARVPIRVGYWKEARRLLLTHGRPRQQDTQGKFLPQYTGKYFDELLDLTDLENVPVKPQLFTDKQGEEEYQKWLESSGRDLNKPLLILVPGASFGPSKIWLTERYAHVADTLTKERNAQVFISYGPGEEKIVRDVKEAMKTPCLTDIRVGLRGLKVIFQQASFVLTNDTGPRHLAEAFGIPHLTIMGPNDPRYTELDSERGEVIREDVACSPCQLKVCPLEEQICMTRLNAKRVLERCLALWPQV